MRLGVLDTSVIVSAAHQARRCPAKLIMDWVLEGQVQAVTSPLIVEEYRRVAQRPKFRRYGFPPLWLDFLIQESMRLPDPVTWPHAGPGPKDLLFLGLAYTAGAWLVTFNLGDFLEVVRNGVRVLSPAGYLAHLMEGINPTQESSY